MADREESLRLGRGVSIIVGTVIGAGILGLPYVVSQTGFPIGAAIIILVYILLVFLGKMIEELSLRNPGHQLVDITGKMLGPVGKYFSLAFLMASIFAALMAYYVGLTNIIYQVTGDLGIGPLGAYILLVMLVVIAYKGLSVADTIEFVITVIMIVLIIGIIGFLSPDVKTVNLLKTDYHHIVKVFGVATFALYGHMVIPEVVEEVKRKPGLATKAVVIGIWIPALLYILFSAIVIGVFDNPPQVATMGFMQISPFIGWLGQSFAALAIITSAVGNVLAMRDIIIEDLKMNKFIAVIGAVLPALILFTKAGFADILSVAGTLGVGGLITVVSIGYAKEGGNPYLRKIAWIIAAIFILAAFTEILYR